jgi:hypothetical protein
MVSGDWGESLEFRRRQTMDNDNYVGGYSVPVDPMDDLQCDSCQ